MRYVLPILILVFIAGCANTLTPEPQITANFEYHKNWLDEAHESVLVKQGDAPILNYYHSDSILPQGVDPIFKRGDYVHPIFGPDGQILTEDFPADHLHHRALNWGWATVKWKGKKRDLFACRGIWTRPQDIKLINGPTAQIIAENLWLWDDKTPVVKETVTITAHPQNNSGRFIDFDIRLKALVNDFAIGGREKSGYGGFNIRMAPAENVTLTIHDANNENPQSWADYTADFDFKKRAGITIFEHPKNPQYSLGWFRRDKINFFQPIWPVAKLFNIPKSKTLQLRYRLWVHKGTIDPEIISIAWTDYVNGIKVKP
jgi:hypothetical protein